MVRTVRDCECINLLQSFVVDNEKMQIYNQYIKSNLKTSTFRTFKADQPFYSENIKWQICNFPQIVRYYKGGMIWENAGEFLYKIKKEDKIIPVHTIALYCGMEEYDGGISILDMTKYEEFPTDLKELFQNYSVKVYQLKDLVEENFETSLREIVAVFKRCQDRDAIKKYYSENIDRFR